jgi:predicted secreted protein
MSVQNSTLTKIYIAGVAVANSTNVNLSSTTAMIDITNKDSGGWRELLAGLSEWSMSGDFIVDFADSKGPDDLYTAKEAKTSVTVKYMNNTSGEVYYQGSAFISSLTLNAGTEGEPNGSFELQGTSTLSQKTLT